MLANKKQLNGAKPVFISFIFFFGCFCLLFAGRFSFNEINLKIEWLFCEPLPLIHTLMCLIEILYFFEMQAWSEHTDTHTYTNTVRLTPIVSNGSVYNRNHSKSKSNNNNKWQPVVVVFIRAIERCKYCWLIPFLLLLFILLFWFGFGFFCVHCEQKMHFNRPTWHRPRLADNFYCKRPRIMAQNTFFVGSNYCFYLYCLVVCAFFSLSKQTNRHKHTHTHLHHIVFE